MMAPNLYPLRGLFGLIYRGVASLADEREAWIETSDLFQNPTHTKGRSKGEVLGLLSFLDSGTFVVRIKWCSDRTSVGFPSQV